MSSDSERDDTGDNIDENSGDSSCEFCCEHTDTHAADCAADSAADYAKNSYVVALKYNSADKLLHKYSLSREELAKISDKTIETSDETAPRLKIAITYTTGDTKYALYVRYAEKKHCGTYSQNKATTFAKRVKRELNYMVENQFAALVYYKIVDGIDCPEDFTDTDEIFHHLKTSLAVELRPTTKLAAPVEDE